MTDAMTYPVLELSAGHLIVVHGDGELRRWSRAGLRVGWHHDLVIIDAELRRWAATLLRARPGGLVGWLQGRVIADLSLGEPTAVELEYVQRQVFDVFDRVPDLWDADGLLAERRRAIRQAHDMRQLIEALETSIL